MKNTTLIPFLGENPHFSDSTDKDYSTINARTFSDKLRDFQPVQNFKFVWEKAAEYLQKIAEVKDYKKLSKATLKVAGKDLEFNKTPDNTTELTLDQKIKSSYKSTLPSLKPKIPR